jgi:hypothetical protein
LVGEEPNHTTARKAWSSVIIQYSLNSTVILRFVIIIMKIALEMRNARCYTYIIKLKLTALP